MRYTKALTIISCVLYFFTANGQASESTAPVIYHPIEAKSPIPESVLTLSSEKFERDLAQIDRSENRKRRKAQEEFYLQSNFIIDELLLSGKVLFNDSLTQYLELIADKLLADRPDLRSEIRFYVVRSGAVNAFATDNGSIFFNMGIFAKLENEAQLAYILCHEIVHYIEKHAIDRAIVSDSLSREGLSRQSNLEKTLLAKANYSKEQESEADLEGFDLFLTSDYDPNAALQALKLLKGSGAPGHEEWKPLERIPLPVADTLWPETYWLDSIVRPDSAKIASIRQYATHPSIDERIAAIKDRLAETDTHTGKSAIVGASYFNRCRNLALKESCHIFLVNRDYLKAMYLAAQMIGEDGDNPYYQWVIDRAYYGLGKYFIYSKDDDLFADLESYHPNLQPLAHFFISLKPEEMGVLSMNHLWVHRKNVEDESYQEMREDLVHSFIQEIDDKGKYLDGSLRMPKYDTAWAEMLTRSIAMWDATAENDDFKERYEQLVKKRKRMSEEEFGHQISNYDPREQVVFLDPMYIKLDMRKDQPVGFLSSEKKQLNLLSYIRQCADKLDLNYRITTPYEMQAQDISQYQEISLLKRYVSDITRTEFDMVPVDYHLMQAYVNNGGSRYLGLSGVYGVRVDKSEEATYYIVASVIMPYLFPLLLPAILTPGYEAATLTYIHDIKTGRSVDSYIHYTDKRDSESTVKSSIYHALQKTLK